MRRWRSDGIVFSLLGTLLSLIMVPVSQGSEPVPDEQTPAVSKFVDNSLLIAPEFPCTWPASPFPRFQITHQRTIGPESPYNIDVLLIDGNTATQLDVPPHSAARPELNREKSGPFGLSYTDVIEPWQFGGEACVVDVRELLDQAPNGVSPLVTAEHVQRFETQHRDVRFGDVVLFRSDYSDKYYRPFPEGNRFLADPLDRKSPAFPDPDPECMDYLGKRGVLTLGTDSASMGPLPDLAEPTHYAGLKYGMIWTEAATALGELPPTGAFYCILAPKHRGGPYSESRAFSIVGGELPGQLIDAVRHKRAVDLSPTLAVDLPVTNPGSRTGDHRQLYMTVNFLYNEYLDLWHHTHLMDSATGTHLIPPSYALPRDDERVAYAPEVRGWLEEYEKKYGPRGTSTLTAEQIPIEWTCGNVRVIDVRSLIGSTPRNSWPASPAITPELVEEYESRQGVLKPGEIVLFQTGFIDTHFSPGSKSLWEDPLTGRSEGWPAPTPETILLLKGKGIRCIGSDAPDLGGVDPRRALMTYWALGTQEMVGVEFLNNLQAVPENAYFLFAALKIRDCHATPGRAIVLY